MIKKMLRLCIFCGLLTLSTFPELLAQNESTPIMPAAQPPRIYVGPIVGFNQNFHSGGFTSFVADVNCPNFRSGNATGFYVGGSFEYLLGDPEDARSSILARLTYDTRPASFEEEDTEYPVLVVTPEDPDGTVIFPVVNHSAEIDYNMINLDIMYKLMVGNTRVGIMVGPAVGMVMDANVQQKFNLVSPLEAQFKPDETTDFTYENDFRTIVIRDGEVPDAAGIRVGVKIGALYELSLSRFIVVPHVIYDFGLTKVTTNEDWRVNAFQAGVDVRFAL